MSTPYPPAERCPSCGAARAWNSRCAACGSAPACAVTAVLRKRDWQGKAAEQCYAGQRVRFVEPLEIDVRLQVLVRLETGPLQGSTIWVDADDLEPEPADAHDAVADSRETDASGGVERDADGAGTAAPITRGQVGEAA